MRLAFEIQDYFISGPSTEAEGLCLGRVPHTECITRSHQGTVLGGTDLGVCVLMSRDDIFSLFSKDMHGRCEWSPDSGGPERERESWSSYSSRGHSSLKHQSWVEGDSCPE